MSTTPERKIAFRAASDLAGDIRARKIGSLELLDHYLDRIGRLNPPINAVVTLDAERARTAARAADERAVRGDFAGPLHGLPLTIKDAIETQGIRTTCGAPVLTDHVPASDADVVARLRAAGAIVFGKTNTPMFAADNQTYNDLFGTTNNPWDVTRTPGGSSGGAAAAVAAGLTSMELGSDIAGSIRNPAHYCGVYGHKPSAGIVSGRGHIPGPPGMLAPADIGVIGPLARSADDLDLAMSVIASPAPADATAWHLELPPPRHNALREYRVAAWLDDGTAPVDGSVLDRLHGAVMALRDAGIAVDETARPPFTLDEMYTVAFDLIRGVTCSGLDDASFDAFARAATQFPPDDNGPVAMFLRASTQSKRAWNAINERRWRMRAGWAEFFRSYDVLLCPAAQTAAFVHDHGANHAARTVPVNGEPRSNAEALAWAGFVGAAGLPASVAPVGFTGEGLPVGVQIVGPYLEDRTTIDFARRLAGVIGGYTPPPGFE